MYQFKRCTHGVKVAPAHHAAFSKTQQYLLMKLTDIAAPTICSTPALVSDLVKCITEAPCEHILAKSLKELYAYYADVTIADKSVDDANFDTESYAQTLSTISDFISYLAKLQSAYWQPPFKG